MEFLDKAENGYYEDYQNILDLIAVKDAVSDGILSDTPFLITYSNRRWRKLIINTLSMKEIEDIWENQIQTD